MVDFNQMQTFAADPLIMVEGRRDPAHRPRGTTLHRRPLGRLRRQPRARQRRDHRRDRRAAPPALVLLADHDYDRPGARARRRADPAHAAAATTSSSSSRAARRRPRRRSRWRVSTTARAAARSATRRSPSTAPTTAPRWARSRRPAGRSCGPPTSRSCRGGLHAHPPIPGSCRACTGSCTLGCLAQLRDVIEHEGPRHGLGGHRGAGDADGRRPRALGRLPARAARALRRDGRAARSSTRS